MEKRANKRIEVSFVANICCEPYLFKCTIINLSANGICLHTSMCFPGGTKCKLIIPSKQRDLEIAGQVKRTIKREGFNETMGLELLNPPQNYIEFINDLSSVF
jgi:hypothetical protein